MAYPKKMKGWRTIVVEGQTFRWKFESDENTGWILVRRDESGSANVKIEIPGTKDPWINIRDEESLKFVPVTPAIVSDLIRTSLKLESL